MKQETVVHLVGSGRADGLNRGLRHRLSAAARLGAGRSVRAGPQDADDQNFGSMSVTNAIHSFPPIAKSTARVLILGTMPGKQSLAHRQYYAHPRNAFWPIVGTLFGFDSNQSYRRRTAALAHAAVALWDVLASCERPSSLDSDIVQSSIVPNPVGTFLDAHPRIEAIYFNGGNAERLFQKYVCSDLDPRHKGIPRIRLPSTSPANASLDFAGKLEVWQRLLIRP